jgi:serine/threonine protein kinase
MMVVADSAATRMTTRRWYQLSKALEHHTYQQYDENVCPYPYAIKRLIPKVYDSPSEYIQTVHDFYMEIQYLSILFHRHIISVIAINHQEELSSSSSSLLSNDEDDDDDNRKNVSPFHNDGSHLFVIMEKLRCTLSYQIYRVWYHDPYHNRERMKQNKLSQIFHLDRSSGRNGYQGFVERLGYAFNIAQAIQYLHEKRYVDY